MIKMKGGCGSKERIEIKRRKLRLELEKPIEEQNPKKILRLQKSIKRNINIAKKNKMYERNKQKRKQMKIRIKSKGGK